MNDQQYYSVDTDADGRKPRPPVPTFFCKSGSVANPVSFAPRYMPLRGSSTASRRGVASDLATIQGSLKLGGFRCGFELSFMDPGPHQNSGIYVHQLFRGPN